MISNQPLPPLALRKRLPAAREKVFAYWTDPDQIRVWLGGPEVEVTNARIDLRVEGEYEYRLLTADGIRSTIKGSFLAIEVPEKLVYSWIVENFAGMSPSTEVTVDFVDLGEETEVFIAHQGFLDQPSLELHQEGWIACFANLEGMLDPGNSSQS